MKERLEIIKELSKIADTYKRQECPASDLVIGLTAEGSGIQLHISYTAVEDYLCSGRNIFIDLACRIHRNIYTAV